MSGHDFHVPRVSVEPGMLTVPRARSVARFANTTANPNVRLLNCYGFRDDGTEAVALTISATVPQRPINDIRQTEHILIVFGQDDGWYPTVGALRKDFPCVPHTNLTEVGEPISLCLYYEPWDEVKLNLTAPKLIARIMWWLEGTANGTLHGEDQPLEPLLFDPSLDLIIPGDLLSGGAASEPMLLMCYTTGWSLRLARSPISPPRPGEKAQVGSCLALVVTCPPQRHSVIQATPRTMSALHDFLVPAGIDLRQILRERLADPSGEPGEFHSAEGVTLVLVVRLPKTRVEGGEVESEELRAFAFSQSISEIAKVVAGHPDDTDTGGPEDIGGEIDVQPLNPRPGFSRSLAARVNGEKREDSTPVIAVGAGALGSQVVVNLVRGGFGQWTLVDHDLLLPHNLGRHALGGWALGSPKAPGLASMLNSIVEGSPIASGVISNVLRNGGSDNQQAVDWKSSSIILDMSASIAVARHLCHDVGGSARRFSLFLNPSGTALTLLAEDSRRTVPLDVLEMQHYRALLWDQNLSDLFSSSPTIRSGVGCRDVSTMIPQDLVSLFSGIGSRAVRRASEADKAQIATWIVDDSNYSVSNFTFDTPDVRRKKKGGWRIFWDVELERKLKEYRNAKLPKETGGVLIGSYDMARRIIYVFDATEAPSDSQESPHGFLRGSAGLQEAVERIRKATSGRLDYIGEWHSHPTQNTEPSSRDRNVIKWVKDTLDVEGQVGVVGIVGSAKRLSLIPCGTALYQ